MYFREEGAPKGRENAFAFYARALPFYEKACELNHAQSCYYLGDKYYGRYTFLGNSEENMKFYEKACDLGYGVSCYAAGYMEPEKRETFYKKAFSSYKKECELKNGDSCSKLGDAYKHGNELAQKDEKKPLSIIEQRVT